MNYQTLLKKIENYKKKYDVKIIGKTEFNRNIFAVEKTLSEDFFTAIFVSGVHAREHITTDLVCRMLDEGLFDTVKNFNVAFILMANPDGVELVYGGLFSAPENYQKFLKSINNGNDCFNLWKANGRGVDINNNFDANYGLNVHSKNPASSGFTGKFAESEKETRAIAEYTKSKNSFLSISYHSKGEEIYFNFFQNKKDLKRDKIIAKRFSKSTGYKIKNVEKVSSGGYKDYCVQKLHIPALTIEVGSDKLVHPIGEEYLEEIFLKHKNVAKDVEFAYNIFIEFEGKKYVWRKIYEKSNRSCAKSVWGRWSASWCCYC